MKHYSLDDYQAYEAIVLANGEFPKSEAVLKYIERWASGWGYFLACCDGAVNKLLRYTDKLPDLVVGDLDSIEPRTKDRLGHRLVHISEQDTNDLSKTITHLSQELGYKRIIILGATGGREDHTLGNLALLPCYAGLVDELVLLTDTGYFRLIKAASSIEVGIGTQVSVFSFDGKPLTLRGVHWPLEGYSLPQLWSGTLNRADEATISLIPSSPTLLFVATTA